MNRLICIISYVLSYLNYFIKNLEIYNYMHTHVNNTYKDTYKNYIKFN